MEYPYIKPTRRVHDSGFRMFEVGYCWEQNGKFHNRVIGSCSDHIWLRGIGVLSDLPLESISIDLTREGYIRFFTFDKGQSEGKTLRWADEMGLSSMTLKLVKVVENLIKII